MRFLSVLITAAAYGMATLILAASIALSSPEVLAEDASLNHGRVSCQPICKSGPSTSSTSYRIDDDAAAALESVQFALSNIGDGSTYVWRRGGSHLSGVVQPTRSFRNATGTICRHVVMLVSKGIESAKAEGVACRLPDGRWNLEG